MGRGLSDLQQTILAMAYRNRNRAEYAHLYTYEIMRDVYHFHDYQTWLGEKSVATPAGYHFTVKSISNRVRYDTLHASLSRSLRRLINRGLLQKHTSGQPAGANLTPQGKEIAQHLTVKEVVLQPIDPDRFKVIEATFAVKNNISIKSGRRARYTVQMIDLLRGQGRDNEAQKLEDMLNKSITEAYQYARSMTVEPLF